VSRRPHDRQPPAVGGGGNPVSPARFLPLENVGNLPVPHALPHSPAAERPVSTPVDDALARAEELLGELNARREELERLAAAEDIDGDAAVDLISELAELARQIEAELTRARNLADADG